MTQPVSYRKPTIRDTATVTLSSPVDGTRRRRGAVAHTRRVTESYSITVHPDVWALAQSVCLPTQRIVIVSDTEVMVVNR